MARRSLMQLNEIAITKSLMDILQQMYDVEEDKFNLFVMGIAVCEVGFQAFYGISNYKYKVACDHVRNNTHPVHGNARRDYDAYLSDLCYDWLRHLCDVHGDHLPNKPEVHLPPDSFKYDWYGVFKKEMSILNNPIPSPSLFYGVWRARFPNLKIPETIYLGKCSLCCEYDTAIRDAKTFNVKSAYRKARKQHRLQCENERTDLMAMASLARDSPTDTHFVGIDAMNPLHLPHLSELPKPCFTKRRPKLHVYGLVDWSTGKRSYATFLQWWSKDTNLNLSILFAHLRKMKQEGYKARKLVLNMDNAKDNKNQYMLAFCIMLVKMGWYESVELHFLMPGHSHFYVDRDCFAMIGKHKRKFNIMHPDAFWDTFVDKCFPKATVKPTRLDFPAVYDWKSYFDSHIRPLQGHSLVRSFRIVCDPSTNIPVMYTKANLTKLSWVGFYDVFGYRLMQSLPDGIPQIIPPTPLPETEFVDIPSFFSYISPTSITAWQKLMQQQFHDGAFCLRIEDFWCLDVDFLEDPEQTIVAIEHDVPEAPIRIRNHPPIVDLQQVEKGVFLAFRTGNSFSIGKVRVVTDTIELKLYKLDDNNFIVRDEAHSEVECCASDVLLYNIQPTKTGKLKVYDARKISAALKT